MSALVQDAKGTWRCAEKGFGGPAYQWIRKSDELPTYSQLGEDPMLKVKLFHTCSGFRYYVAAATMYDGIDGPVLTGWVTGLAEDEFGDTALEEIAAIRVIGLPVERDVYWTPKPLSAVMGAVV